MELILLDPVSNHHTGAVYLNGETLDGFSLRHDEAFSVEVPVMDSNLKPSRFTITESLGDDVSGPVVSWDLKEGTEDQLFTPEAPGKIFFEAGPVTDANSTSTTPWNLTVTNEYAQIAFDKTIDGALPGDLASTTILSPTADEMTIRYTVENLGVDGDTAIQIQDKSLLDYEFVLPEGIEVSEDGTITGCTFEFVDGEATCEITVGIPGGTDQDFRYEAAQAEATATLTVEVGDRTVIASATDGHGALRLSKLAGMLPATGVTTLVWTLGLGLLIAVGSVVYFVRSRRD